MTINPTTGLISWKPTTDGTFTFRVRVTDTNGLFSERSYTITVTDNKADEEDLFVESINFLVDEVFQGSEIVAHVTIENQGDDDFEDLVISMAIEDLGISVATNKFDLDDGDKETKELILQLPNKITDGYYVVKFTVKNDDISVIKYREIKIVGERPAATQTSDADVVFQTSISGYQPPAQKAQLNWFGIWFTILLLLALLAVATYLVRRLAQERQQEGVSIVALDNDTV
jgi:hypothetical protein